MRVRYAPTVRLGAINQENNGALTKAISELLAAHGAVPADRVYLNFFDVARAPPSPRLRRPHIGRRMARRCRAQTAAGADGPLPDERRDRGREREREGERGGQVGARRAQGVWPPPPPRGGGVRFAGRSDVRGRVAWDCAGSREPQ